MRQHLICPFFYNTNLQKFSYFKIIYFKFVFLILFKHMKQKYKFKFLLSGSKKFKVVEARSLSEAWGEYSNWLVKYIQDKQVTEHYAFEKVDVLNDPIIEEDKTLRSLKNIFGMK